MPCLSQCQTLPPVVPASDIFLAWLSIMAHLSLRPQVEMLTAHEINCPISLEAPVCPQITPCGHVFAFSSIMAHLMSHGGDNLRKASPCPLCFQPIVARELRLVQIKVVTPPKVPIFPCSLSCNVHAVICQASRWTVHCSSAFTALWDDVRRWQGGSHEGWGLKGQ